MLTTLLEASLEHKIRTIPTCFKSGPIVTPLNNKEEAMGFANSDDSVYHNNHDNHDDYDDNDSPYYDDRLRYVTRSCAFVVPRNRIGHIGGEGGEWGPVIALPPPKKPRRSSEPIYGGNLVHMAAIKTTAEPMRDMRDISRLKPSIWKRYTDKIVSLHKQGQMQRGCSMNR